MILFYNKIKFKWEYNDFIESEILKKLKFNS
jgi:hypothetical protein